MEFTEEDYQKALKNNDLKLANKIYHHIQMNKVKEEPDDLLTYQDLTELLENVIKD